MVACRDDSAAVPENLNRIIGIVPPVPPPGDGQFTRVVKRRRAAGKSFMVGNRARSSGDPQFPVGACFYNSGFCEAAVVKRVAWRAA